MGFVLGIQEIEADAAAKIRKLENNERGWYAQLKNLEESNSFQEQRVDEDGRRRGVRTSDHDRAVAEAKKQERVTQIRNQLAAIRAEISKIQSDTELLVLQGESKIISLR